MAPFLIALQFLTRIPVRLGRTPDATAIGRSLAYYPLVGLIIGALIIATASGMANTPAMLRAALLLALWVALTGALHLDGLADSADAWIGGHGNPERTLAIMKDPTSGPIAVTTVVIVLLIKFAALNELSPDDWRFVWVPAIARATVPMLFNTTPYVRPGGIGSRMAEHRSPYANAASVVITSLLTLISIGGDGIVLLAIAIVIFLGLRAAMMHRLGGTTGDTAGALIEVSETALVAALVLI